MKPYLFLLLLIFYVFSGCTRPPETGDDSVSYVVEERLNSSVTWRRGDDLDMRAVSFIENAIGRELTPDSAIQIALLNNPKIQATFEELGIAQADLIEAGLLSNPSFEIEIREPTSKGVKTNIEYLITSSLLDIFLIPLRTRLASTEFEQAKLKVSNTILDLAFEVRSTFYALVAEEEKLLVMHDLVDLTSILEELASKQVNIGNVNPLDYQLAYSRLLDEEIKFKQTQAEIIQLREKINQLLGFSEDVHLLVPQHLSDDNADQEMKLCDLEAIALENRLDLKVAQFEIVRLRQALGLKEWWTFTNLRAGLAGEREPDGVNVIGPGFSGELPIFNYGQAARKRLFAQLRQAQDRLAELEIQILAEVRTSYKLVMAYKQINEDYQFHVLPLQSRISSSSEALYNVMGLGVDRLLDNKRLEVMVFFNYAENKKRYLVAKVELDKSLGGYLRLLEKEAIREEFCHE